MADTGLEPIAQHAHHFAEKVTQPVDDRLRSLHKQQQTENVVYPYQSPD